MRVMTWVGFAALVLAGCDRVLEEGLDPGEATEILVRLAEAGIQGDRRSGGRTSGWEVRVAPDDLARSWGVLRSAGLPRRRHAGFQETYRERGLVPGRLEERALFLTALQEEMAQTLESVPGVRRARVHVSVGDDRLPAPERERPTASVLLEVAVAAGGEPPVSEADVRRLVARAMAGLEAERVEVIFARTPSPSLPRLEAGSGEGLRWLAAGVGALGVAGSVVALRRRRRRPTAEDDL